VSEPSIRKRAQDLVAEANALIDSIPAAEAIALLGREDVTLVDLRDIRERVREGFVPGSVHAPRGMLEFWVDPESPYHRDLFASGNHFVFYCASGWRSALATRAVHEMGLAPVSHVGDGFSGWVAAGGPVLKTDDGREPKGNSG
jgi:rhodanese-related sulfurtransferase